MSANSVSHLTLRDGRRLAFQQFGLPEGRPIHFFHGFPSSRLLAALLHEKALRAGVCLIAADRPGFGESTPQPGRSIEDWAGDVTQLADHLGHERFDVMGVSCGGAYALACAARIPQRLKRVALIAGMGPMDLPEIRKKQMPPLKVMFGLARLHPRLISPMLALDRKMFRGDRQRALKMISGLLTAPDAAVLAAHLQVADGFLDSMAEAYAQGIEAAMWEAALIARPRGFALQDIAVPVHVHQGAFDRHVPVEMGRYLAQQMPGATLHEYADEGHLSILWNRFDAAVAGLIAA